jgi:hypothetical protein
MRRHLKWLLYPLLLAALWWAGSGLGRAFTALSSGGATASASQLGTWFCAYLLLGLALGVLAAWDISTWFGSTSERFIFGTGGRALHFDPRLKQAEALLKDRQPLAAIEILRAHLGDKPREWQAAARIAEIYQGPLHNPLAAALEYEELLKHGRLPRAARPWILLRLGDTYLFLNRGDAATAQFTQVVSKYPRSGAAEKARRRLAAAEPAPPPPAPEPAPTAPVTPGPKLPPGFRPFDARHPRPSAQ